ncbi:hypothetical protein [Paraburkholderia susongensis]|uniref:hypothetical protein n=1 Tax=Paraburkholderia susongensis TaxID=1515439 RepID=UPI001180C539
MSLKPTGFVLTIRTLEQVRAVLDGTEKLEFAPATDTQARYAWVESILKRLRERLKQLPNEKRPGRTSARAVKSRPFRYTVRALKRDLN